MTKLESSIDRRAAGEISMSPTEGLTIRSMGEAMEFSKLMAIAAEAVPKHCRNAPGVCLAICVQAYEWRMNPLALANKSYVVNDRLCWESALYQSVVSRRAPIVGRIKMEYFGKGDARTCRVWATLTDGTGVVEYTSPEFKTINPKNSPLWKNDPDQQLFYFSVRAFARRHFPDVMIGIYTVDEMQDATPMVVQQAAPSVNLQSLTQPKLAEQPTVEVHAEPAHDRAHFEKCIKHASGQDEFQNLREVIRESSLTEDEKIDLFGQINEAMKS
jgi:hypothetical protein